MLAPELVAVIVCPKSKQPMIYFPRGELDQDEAEAFFLCPASRLRYRVIDEVPDFVVEDATVVPAAEVDRLVARARALKLALPQEYSRA
jgi:uncharacterized protein YbaR (Trm112 family)